MNKMNFDLTKEIKKYLTNSTINFYNDMRLDIDLNEYKDHYASLGEQLVVIENIKSVKDFIDKTMNEELVCPGSFPIMEEIEETINNVITDYFKTNT